MTTYRAPIEDIVFAFDHIADLPRAAGAAAMDAGLDREMLELLIGQAGQLAEGVLAPLNQSGDAAGARFAEGVVRMPDGFVPAYRQWREGGWNGVSAPEAWGGSGLPVLLNAAVLEMHTSACMALAMGPVVTQGAVDALLAHGDADLCARYLPRLVSGEWMASMALTEPQAGSDLALIRCKAVPAGDGTYRLSGQKIFITYGEHDLTDNIVHMVLARLPDAPAGTRGLSLFLVPKLVPDGEGRPGARNDVVCAGIEHKMGLRASPTCTLVFGERQGGAVAWLVGEPHRGLACMFTMMNRARLATGLQGVAIAERACQQALLYAWERRQGRAPDGRGGTGEAPSPIVAHPDVGGMLLAMRARTAAARAIAYATATAIDRAERGEAEGQDLADLFTPVTKAFCSETGIEVASLAIQVHGGMGVIEEAGVAQHLRDVRVTAIYEGTNGIQAIDLVTRKLPRKEGGVVAAVLSGWEQILSAVRAASSRPELTGIAPPLAEAIEATRRATAWVLAPERTETERLVAATPYLRLFGLTAGCALLAKGALAAAARLAEGEGAPVLRRALVNAEIFATRLAPAAPGLARVAMAGADAWERGRESLTVEG
jgi:acyl-CoA dehydrogenase